MPLEEYRRKRRFARTPEPEGKQPTSRSHWRFVVQKHAARRLHYDFRLELNGVLKSWAVPKGPSLDPREKRLAVEVEDHPIEYIDFEGAIPEGEYGGGTVIVWDRGTWQTADDPAESLEAGKLKFELHGEKLRGAWTLVRMRPRRGEERNQWLLIKERDDEARNLDEHDVLEAKSASALSGRTLEEVAADPKRTWKSNRASVKGAKPREEAKPKAAVRKKSARKPARAQPSARFDGAVAAPFPGPFAPALARVASRVPEGDDWLHEIKYDGYRLLCHIDAGNVVLRTRNGLDWTARYPEVARAARDLPVRQAVLDGEIVALLPSGLSSFQELQNAQKEGNTGRLVYFTFDLLYLDGFDLRGVPLEQRKARLAEILGAAGGSRIQYADHMVGHGPEFLQQSCRMGLEGIISKRRDRRYRSGRRGDWLKAKCVGREEFVIGGFTDPTRSRKGLGALLVGYFAPDSRGGKRGVRGSRASKRQGSARRASRAPRAGGLIYAGKVGTGFSEQTLTDLRARLESLEESESPFENLNERRRGTHWVRPELVAQIEFSDWTRDGRLRHPVFQGLREDKPAKEVVREAPPAVNGAALEPEQAATGSRSKSARGRGSAKKGRSADLPEIAESAAGLSSARRKQLEQVQLTSPDRVLYAGQGVTKLGLASYYVEIADWILPHVADRPLSLVRCPQGQGKPCFFQKHAAKGVPETLRRVPIEEKEGTALYLAVDDLAGLVGLVQMGVLEIHPWGARSDQLDRPDRITFDLDPDPGVAWPQVVRAARELHDRLDALGLAGFLKTTGGKGLHVVVPIQRRHDWPEVKEFSKSVAEQTAADAPDRYTASLAKAARKGRIFIDYLRNDRGATAVAAYSTRARPGAPVATPLAWDELSPALRSDHFHVGNLPGRLASLRSDPWEELPKIRQSLTAKVKKKLGRF